MQRKGLLAVGLVAALAAMPAMAQDSVSNTGCLPGDALNPWDATQQCRDYVVDLCPFDSSKGNEFGIAPIVKSSKSDPGFFTSLISAQGISRKILKDVAVGDLPSSGYSFWNVQGAGVNGLQNDPPLMTLLPAGNTAQMGFGFAEFNGNYNGVIGGTINVDPCDPTRLYVCRRQAANNGCDPTGKLSTLNFGSVDADGTVIVRSDDFGLAGPGTCGALAGIVGNNIIRVRTGARDCGLLNVVSGTYPGLFDAAAVAPADLLVFGSGDTYNTPGLIPSAVTGATTSLYIGTTFVPTFVRGLMPPLTSDVTHFAPGVTNQRGNVSYSCDRCPTLMGAGGMAGIIGLDAGGNSTIMNIFGLDAAGNPTSTLGVSLPALVVDDCQGRSNIQDGGGMPNQMDHYHSQVAFNGGNGQIALGTDSQGNLLAAAQVTHPTYTASTDPFGYIVVAKIDCNTGSVLDYTMAGYNTSADPNTATMAELVGKEICNETGTVIGEMCPLFFFTGSPVGPGFSAPSIDAKGNVWFVTAMQIYVGAPDPGPGGDDIITAGLVRAILDETNFCYRLELVFRGGDVFRGKNSATDYRIGFISISDSNSVSSGGYWSQNISDEAHMGMDPADIASPMDPRSLGGLIVSAEVQYDRNGDGMFDDTTGCAASGDEEYNSLLYVGSVAAGAGFPDFDGDGDVDLGDFANFSLCFGGANVPPAASCPGGINADFDCDGDVDLGDFANFSLCFGGANNPIPGSCPL